MKLTTDLNVSISLGGQRIIAECLDAEIHIGCDEIRTALGSEEGGVLTTLNRVGEVLRAIQPSTIETLTDEVRGVIRKFLYEQSTRF